MTLVALRRLDLVAVLDALELAGERLALGLTLRGLGRAGLVLCSVFSLRFFLQRHQGLGIKQLTLMRIHAFAALAETPLLEPRHLNAQGRVAGLLEFELNGLGFELC